MAPKFDRKLSDSQGEVKDLDDPSETTPVPKEKKGGRITTPAKRPAKKRIKKDAEEEQPDVPSEKPKRAKKVREGPYTIFKEQGSIPEPQMQRRAAGAADLPGGKSGFNVLAWNVGSLRAFLRTRVADLQEAVKQGAPHVLGIIECLASASEVLHIFRSPTKVPRSMQTCFAFRHKLQEGTADTEGALGELSKALPDYRLACVNYSTVKKGYSGTLVMLHKEVPEPMSVAAEDLPSAAAEGRLVVCEFNSLFVVLCYVPNSGDGLKRLSERIEKWDPQLRERLRDLAQKKSVVLMGDLNVAHQDKDIWNVEAPHVPKSAGLTPEERESFSKLLESGFKDRFTSFCQSCLPSSSVSCQDGFALHHPEAV